MKLLRCLALLLVLLSASGWAAAGELVVLCAGAVKPVLSVLQADWSARSGHTLAVSYASAGELLARIAAGEHADIVILPLEAFAAVDKSGRTSAASRRDLGAVGIGVAVKQGAPLPDLSSEASLRQVLLAARSLTFMDPARGTSGKHMDEVVLPRLGIRDQVRAKAVLGEGGMIAEKVARGEVEIAFQQMTELLPVSGIQIAGVLPPSLQKTTVYSAAVTTAAASPVEAAELLAFLASSQAQAVFTAKGFAQPPR